MRQALAGTSRVALAVVTLTLAQSVWWSPAAPLPFSLLVGGLAGLAAWRPAWGLLALAALAPFGRMIAVVWLGGFPVRGAEAMALAVLAGVAVRRLARPIAPDGPPARITGPWVLFATTVVASAAVLYRVSQFYVDYPAVFAKRLLTYLAVGYHGLPGDPRPWLEPVDFRYVAVAVLVVEGVALLLVTGRLAATTPGFAKRLIAVTVASGTVAALMSVNALLVAALSAGATFDGITRLIAAKRWAVHLTKVNTAGSYFVLVNALTVGFAIIDRGHRFWWTAAAAVIFTGLWLTASLAAILSGAAVAGAAVALWWWRSGSRSRRHAVVAIGLVATVAVITAVRTGTRQDALASLGRRWAITEVSLATAAEAPLFGVGIGSYPLRSQPHVTEAVRAGFGAGSIPAHNYVLEIAAELGLVGLGLFLWALVVTFRQALTRKPRVGAGCGVVAAAAVAAFLVSALSGQPMLVDAVAIPVWLVLGVMAGQAPATRPPGVTPAWVWLGALVLVITVPFRMAGAVREIDPRRAAHGTTLDEIVEGDANRLVHRLDGPARLFVSASAAAVSIAARADGDSGPGGLFLRITADGIVSSPLALPPGVSRVACINVEPLARRAAGFRAVDVEAVTASGKPASPGVAWAVAVGLDQPCGR